MKFSAFSSFGNFGFRASEPLARTFYEEKLRNIGYETNFTFDENLKGQLFADAMIEGMVRNTLERALNQGNPDLTTQFLEEHEYENGITPLPTQTRNQRRDVLVELKRLLLTGHLSSITQALNDLLGDDLVFYRTTRVPELPGRASFSPTVAKRSLYAGWQQPIRIEAFVTSVTRLNEPIDVRTRFVAGHGSVYKARQYVLASAGTNARVERVKVKSATALPVFNNERHSLVRATFTKPHAAGELITSGHHPLHFSDKRRHFIVLRNGKAVDKNTRHSIDALMRRLVRGTSTWHICEEKDVGSVTTGPFEIGVSHLDACTVGEVGV